MCGITGIISPDASIYIQKMTDAIAHRGPDDDGIFSEGNVAFGHVRLSILDLSVNGHQPMISEDGRFILVFNGEIYNHWDIREKIKDKYSFKSTSDTETILYGFIEYGVGLFSKLNGIFAFSIYDKQKNELFIVRDQFGVKPLYYFRDENLFLYSSEIKSIISSSVFNNNIDENALANYLYFLWSCGENTPFKNSKKLLPGHYITINTTNLHTFAIHKYYEIPFTGIYEKKSELEWIEELDAKLTKAVERQLLSDVPVGYFLSGGLDSSLIVAIAKKLYPNKKIKCFTIDTETNRKLEGFVHDLPYAKIVANHLNVDLEVVTESIGTVENFDHMIYHLDEPQSDLAPLNVANICKKAREQGYLVLLGGTAGDDLFSGYRRHQILYYTKKFENIPYFLKLFIQKLSVVLPTKSAFSRRLKKSFSIYEYEDKQLQIAALFGWLPIKRVKKLFQKEPSLFQPNAFLKESLSNIPNESSELNQMLFLDMKYFLCDHNLNYIDKMSMMHAVEVRVPFLDLELVEFSTKIPPDLKMKGTTTKYLLKKVAEKYLPKEVIYRSKTGFGGSVRKCITEDMDEIIKERLSPERLSKRGIFNPISVCKLIEDNKKSKIDASYSIWALLAIESWMIQFVDRKNLFNSNCAPFNHEVKNLSVYNKKDEKSIKSDRLFIIGTIPPPLGGVTIHVKRLMHYCEKNKIPFKFVDFKKSSPLKIILVLFEATKIHLHTSNVMVRLYFSIFCAVFKKKLIITYHGNLYRFNRLKNFFDILSLKLAYQPILLNKMSYLIALKLNSRSKILSAFFPPIEEKKLDEETQNKINLLRKNYKFIFLTSAFNLSFDKDKKEIYQISELVTLFNQFEDQALIICDVSSTYQKYFSKRGVILNKNILLIPFTHNFISVIKSSDCLIRYTTTDGDSLSVHEALYYQKMVIATNVVDRPDNVILVDLNIKSLSKAITNLTIADYNYQPPNVLSELMKIYNN